jgi:hypothetical protein
MKKKIMKYLMLAAVCVITPLALLFAGCDAKVTDADCVAAIRALAAKISTDTAAGLTRTSLVGLEKPEDDIWTASFLTAIGNCIDHGKIKPNKSELLKFEGEEMEDGKFFYDIGYNGKSLFGDVVALYDEGYAEVLVFYAEYDINTKKIGAYYTVSTYNEDTTLLDITNYDGTEYVAATSAFRSEMQARVAYKIAFAKGARFANGTIANVYDEFAAATAD